MKKQYTSKLGLVFRGVLAAIVIWSTIAMVPLKISLPSIVIPQISLPALSELPTIALPAVDVSKWFISLFPQDVLADSVDLYWVGGSATWDNTAGTKWATSSGGAGGHAVPLSTNKVIFDAVSSANTVIINSAVPICADLTFAGTGAGAFAGVITGTGGTVNIYGSLTLVAGMTMTAPFTAVYKSTAAGKTITLATKSLAAETFDGVSGGWTFQDTHVAVGTITLTNGAVNTNTQIVTAGGFASTNANVRTWDMTSTTMTVNTWDTTTVTSLTLTTTTSTLNIGTSATADFDGGGKTYDVVVLTIYGSPTAVTGSNTYGTFTIANTASGGAVSFAANQLVTGTLTMTGAGTSSTRLLVYSSVGTTQRTLTAATVAVTNTGMSDMKGAGAGSWNIAAGNNIDNGGNTDIIFTSASTTDLYWVGGLGSWSQMGHWSTVSRGGGGHALPVATNNVIFDDASFTAVSQSMTWDSAGSSIHDLTITGLSYNPTIGFGTDSTFNIYGNLTLQSTGYAWQSGNSMYFLGSDNVTLTSAGRAIHVVYIQKTAGSSVTLNDNLTTGAGTYAAIVFSSGNFNSAGYTITAYHFTASGSAVRTLDFSTSNLVVPGRLANSGSPWSFGGTNITLNILSATVYTYIGTVFAGSYDKDFIGGGYTYGDVTIYVYSESSGGTADITGINTFHNLSLYNVGTITSWVPVYFNSDQIVTGNLIMAGNNASTKRLKVTSSAAVGRELRVAGSVSVTNCDISWILASGTSAPWNVSAGANADFGHNFNIIFSVTLYNYWVGNTGSWSDISHWASTTGGVGGTGRVPIASDVAVFDANSVILPGRTITFDVLDIGTLDCYNITNTPTFATGGYSTLNVYGNLYVGTVGWPSMSIAMINQLTPSHIKTMTAITGLTINTASMTCSFDNNAIIGGAITISSGYLDLNDYSVTAASFDSSVTTYDRALYMGSGTFTLNSAAAVTKWHVHEANYVQYAETSTLVLTSAAANAQTVSPGVGQTFRNVFVAGSGNYALTIDEAATFYGITVDRTAAAKTVKFPASKTTTISSTSGFSIPVAGATRTTLTTTSGTSTWTLSMATGQVSTDYIDIQYGVGSGGAVFYAGAHSTIQDGTIANNGGVMTGSPVALFEGSPNTPTVTTVGAFTATLGSSTFSGVATSGAAVLVTGSPKALAAGVTAVTTTGVPPGTITISVTGSNWSLTAPATPAASTTAATSITLTGAKLNGNIAGMGGYSSIFVYFHYGTDPALASYISTSLTAQSGTGVFNATVGSLTSDTPYYFQAVASDGLIDLSSGAILTFTTLGAPIVVTNAAATITTTSATLQGVISTLGIYTPVYVYFQWDTTGTYASPNITPEQTMTAAMAFNQPIIGLVAGTTYHYRAALRYNGASYVYGADTTFIATVLTPPVVVTSGATSITLATATLQGGLTDMGGYGTVSVYFEFGLTASYGTTTPLQSVTTLGTFTQAITGLVSNTLYHYRAKVAYGSGSIANGGDVTFTTIGNGNPGVNAPDILAFVDAKVVSGYLSPGDQMYLTSYKCIYINGNPSLPASDFFVMQILNNNAVVGQWPLPDWGYQPAGLYLGPASALPFGGTYTIKITGIPSKWIGVPPSCVITLSSNDWYGTDLTQLDNWVLSTAKSIGQFYNVDLITYTATGTVLNAAGGALFNSNISGLSQVRPRLFSVYASRPSPIATPNTNTQFLDTWNTSTRLGPYINSLLQSGATSFHMDQVPFNNLIGSGIWLIIVVLLLFAFKGSFMAPLISAPVLLGISWVGLLIPQIVVILAILDITLLAYSLLPRGTG